MILNRRLSGLFAPLAMLAVSVWAVGCAEETVDDPAGNGEAVNAPDNDPATDAGGDIDDPAGATDTDAGDDFGLEGGSTTGAGTEVPDPLPELPAEQPGQPENE